MQRQNTYALEFHNNPQTDFQCIRTDMNSMAHDWQQNIQHLHRKLQHMDQYISYWHMLYALDNRYSWHILDDIQHMDRHNILASMSKNQRYLFLCILHLHHMDSFDKPSLQAHSKL